jgi:hypothetical protein
MSTISMHCERCSRQYRQILTIPTGSIVQDWHAQIGKPAVSVGESDPDICTDCEQEVFDACEAAQP